VNPRLQQTTSSAHIFQNQVWIWRNVVHINSKQYCFKFLQQYLVRFSRRHCHKIPNGNTKGSSPNYSFQKWNETERFSVFARLQNPFLI
jgi:hypothetical protein